MAEINKKGPNPEPRVSNPIALHYAKALSSRYNRVYRDLDFYLQLAIEKIIYFLIFLYSCLLATFVAELDKKGPNPEPRVSNPIALNYAKALASRFFRVYRVLDFYSPASDRKKSKTISSFTGAVF